MPSQRADVFEHGQDLGMYSWFASRESYLGHALRYEEGTQVYDFLGGEKVLLRRQLDALGGHAV